MNPSVSISAFCHPDAQAQGPFDLAAASRLQGISLMWRNGYIYILTNYRKTVLYIGVTSNLRRRVYQHKCGLVPGFSKKYKVKNLIYYEVFNTINEAIFRERFLKGKTRLKKELLISKVNPHWNEINLEHVAKSEGPSAAPQDDKIV